MFFDPPEERTVIDKSHLFSENRHGVLTQVEAYWHALRGNRMLPKRSEIDPRGIEDALEYAFIAERIAPGMGRLRVAGAHLNDLIGMEVRGMPLGALFTLPSRAALSGCLDEVFEGPATARIDMIAERGVGRPAIEARMSLLPLKSDLGDVSRVLGCLSTNGMIGRRPRRFDIATMSVSRVVDRQMIEAEAPQTVAPDESRDLQRPTHKKPRKNSEFSEDAAAFHHPGGARKAPHLRLVKSDG